MTDERRKGNDTTKIIAYVSNIMAYVFKMRGYGHAIVFFEDGSYIQHKSTGIVTELHKMNDV